MNLRVEQKNNISLKHFLTFQKLEVEDQRTVDNFVNLYMANVGKLFQKTFDVEIDHLILTTLATLHIFKSPDNLMRVFNKTFENIISEQLENSTLSIRNFSKTDLIATFKKLNLVKGFDQYFSFLWFSSLPCFDIKDFTAEKNGESSILKSCYWKSTPIPCSAIFRKIPTDAGMCCAFNQADADKIFHDSKYAQIMKAYQTNESCKSFENSSLPDWYVEHNEPISQSGTLMGLTVVLDAHTDMTTEFSIPGDFQGFTAMIMPPGDFPLIYQGGFEVRVI